jgi:hypothetical protein
MPVAKHVTSIGIRKSPLSESLYALKKPQHKSAKMTDKYLCSKRKRMDEIVKYRRSQLAKISTIKKIKLINQKHKKRPNTIPIFGLGKWLLGESRALKVGIYARLVQPSTLSVAKGASFASQPHASDSYNRKLILHIMQPLVNY